MPNGLKHQVMARISAGGSVLQMSGRLQSISEAVENTSDRF